ncbi:HAMP domain-containing histidine kinase [Fulvivirgaceae bacterium PWU37]|uniref:histidine kinase n=2 Tax=Dawidia soli TaxID=2782352 RepID=A0AAP2D6R3_9BACT|nr:HAMP domain-containing sensor histidine kinase [Dawidia soli]MBT1686319.1 HAMP domain-containing histidine kinase [Dawidia soli]
MKYSVFFMGALLVMLTAGHVVQAQDKQMIQIKTFDEKLKPLKNIELSLNDGAYISSGSKGSAFVEVGADDLPVKSVRIRDEKLEAASWNFSRGVIEIIVRQRSYTLVRMALRLPNGRPIPQASVVFKGTKPVTVTTNQAGEFELPLPLQEKLTSADQFQVQDMKVLRINLSENVLVAERSKAPAKTTTLRDQLSDFDLSRLDSIQSLTVFYAVFKNISMSNLSPEARARIDAKFRELVGRMQDSVSRRSDYMANISDSSFVAEDIHNLLSHASRESEALDVNRTAFEEKIGMITGKLQKGVSNLDEETRKTLLADLDRLELMLIENESKFYKNQNDYREIINTLKDTYFDVQHLEERLSITQQKRAEEQALFQQRLLITIGILIVFGVLIVLLVSFSGRLRRQREALRMANEEITTINENLEAIVVKRTLSLEESNRELDTFLYRASHDLRSPLSSILGLCHIGEKMPVGELVERIQAVVLKMDRMLKKLIETSEISQEARKVARFCVREAIGEVQTRLATQITASGVEFHVDCQDNIQLRSSAPLVKTILAHLVENALYFSRLRSTDHARVEVKAEAEGNTVLLTVYDNGVGIDNGVRTDVFNMFFIGHESSKGSGLGLYVARKAAQALEGRIDVASEPGHYARFTVVLPVGA